MAPKATANETRVAGQSVGPILVSRGVAGGVHRIAAIVVRPTGEPPTLRTADGSALDGEVIGELFASRVWRFELEVDPDRAFSYSIDGKTFRIAPCGAVDLRIAYVSCNGQEDGDLERPLEERDVMWNRLADEHRKAPFALMFEGGDQLYADDVLECHESVVAWADASEKEKAEMPLSDEAREAIRFFYFNRYAITYSRPAMALLSSEVPAAMMWDDHDIFDGWGSHPGPVLDGPIGRGLFEAAREMFLYFQLAARDGDLPETVHDRSGESLGYHLDFPKMRVVVPDLRSERRRERVMGPKGWQGFEAAMAGVPSGSRIMVMSSVPVMGPRLSWIEFVADYIPQARKYEDDLRDQWQSRSHRSEWTRLLNAVVHAQENTSNRVTIVSGEIHLATRGVMRLRDGSRVHQLVSSGISHPAPPKAYALVLTALARIGESPLAKRKIKMHRMPSIKTVYVEERNFLVLDRENGEWSASWEFEGKGRTAPLQLD